MTRNAVLGEQPLHWIGSSLKDIMRFPSEVQRTAGFALSAAQYGGKHPSAKPWKGEGHGMLEIVKDFDGDTYRAFYTLRFVGAVYVLHVFQKKSATWNRNPPIRCRSGQRAPEDRRPALRGKLWLKAREKQVIDSSGNVFADMGLPDANELGTKVRLGAAINQIIARKRLGQAEVATLLGINQPKVSALQHYKLEGFSVERLMHFLVALGQDVEIVVKSRPRSRSARIAVKAA